ncbi:MAG: glycolate oxidase subunit GlcE [bacterium]
MHNKDCSTELIAQVKELINDKQSARIQGQHSRPAFSHAESDCIISTREHCGIIHYEPSELVLKVRAGTKIKDIERLLTDNKQQLGTDFPDYGHSTIGGAIASGETGSGRPFLGAIRDHVLGLGLINGRGELLQFGGQVMKNVAGYDVPRLLCGSQGHFALITDVTLKVIPLKNNKTVELADCDNPLTLVNTLATKPLPITAALIEQGKIRLRLSGSDAVIEHAIAQLNAHETELDERFWKSIDNNTHSFFQDNQAIWQIRLSATQALHEYDKQSLINWCGHLRYIKKPITPEMKDQYNISIVNLSDSAKMKLATPDDNKIAQISLALKNAFDPQHIFNSSC